ncbi:hypothetical protein [Methylobacterium radiotolerans]
MSASPAPQLPASGSSVDQLFDFAASHARVTERLKAALDGNCASKDDFETLNRTQHMQGIWIAAKASVSWKSQWRRFAGRARGNIEYVHPADLAAVARSGFDSFAAKPAHVETLVAMFTASPAKGFAAGKEISLGAVPVEYASEEHCDACNGRKRVPCTNCVWGQVTCTGCYGSGTYHSSGRTSPCGVCNGSGKRGCVTCGTFQTVACQPCGQTGIFTTIHTGHIHADVVYEVHTPAGQDESWTKALTKSGHAWLAEAGFVSPPHVSRHAGGVGVGWDVKVPVLGQKFRIKGKEYQARYVGRTERMWRLPYFLDDLMNQGSYILKNAKAADAFSLSRNVRVLDAIRSVVLHRNRPDEVLAASFENAVSVSFIEGVRRTLEAKRDAIARSTIRSVWSYAAVALTTGALVALASGQIRMLLASFNPNQHQPDAAAGAALVGGLFLAASLGITWLLAGLAGRSAVRTVLETDAERLPSQGRTPIFAAAGSLAVYAACAYLLVGGSPNSAVAAVSRPASVAAARPAPAPPPIPFDSIPHVKPPTVPWVR